MAAKKNSLYNVLKHFGVISEESKAENLSLQKIVNNGQAVLRGVLRGARLRLFHKNELCFGKRISVFRGVVFRIYKGSRWVFGHRCKIGKNAFVSVLSDGVLMLGDGVSIGENSRIVCHEKISIGKDTLLAPNVMIYDHDHVFDSEIGVHKRDFKTSPIVIGENCWIGANTVILRGTIIGKNCVIGAGSVVSGDIPDGTLFVQKRDTQMRKIR